MRQFDSVSEELDPENVQCALDFENTMNELETQLYYRHLPPKERLLCGSWKRPASSMMRIGVV